MPKPWERDWSKETPQASDVTEHGYKIGAVPPWERQWGANAQDEPETTAARVGGLAARTGIQAIPGAIAGLPALGMDAYDSLRNATAMASNAILPKSMEQPLLPPFRHSGALADVGVRMADAAGTPKPATQMEQGLVDVGSAGLSAGGGAGGLTALSKTLAKRGGSVLDLVMAELSEKPIMQGLGAAGGASASNLAQSSDLPAPLVIGAGVIGGGATSAGVTGATRTAGAMRSAYRPFTTAGRDIIAGKVINRFATNPMFAAEHMEKAVELVPGSQPTMAQVSRDPGLIAFENGVRTTLDSGASPGGSNRIGQRYGEQNTARQQYLATEAKDAAALQAAKRDKARTYREEGEPAFAGKSPVGVDPQPVFDRIAAVRKSFDGKRKEVQGAMGFAEERLSQPGVDYTDPQQLYAIRKDLAKAREGKYSGKEDLRFAKGQLSDVIRTLDKTIESGAPGFSRYMKIYEERARKVDQLKTMQKMRNDGSAAATDPTSKQDVLQLGKFQNAMEKAMASGAGDKLTDQQIKVAQDVIDDLDRAAAPSSNVAKVPGSDTMRNLSIGSIIGRIIGDNPGPVGAPAQAAVTRGAGALLSWLYSMPDEQVGQLIVDAVLDPKLAARLSRHASKHEIESIARELAWRSRVGTTGSAIYGQAAE